AVELELGEADFQHVVGVLEELILVHIFDIAWEIARIVVLILGLVGGAGGLEGDAAILIDIDRGQSLAFRFIFDLNDWVAILLAENEVQAPARNLLLEALGKLGRRYAPGLGIELRGLHFALHFINFVVETHRLILSLERLNSKKRMTREFGYCSPRVSDS